ncbi:uncharacterized protein LOC112588555 isoform X1 [Harpegnathos saltator]|uniref:uncharacterized protein LOC112588555 isoform X1 n=1 Tax=Harpegnathos saltator TaxID=610380 RepID=UPI000DBEE3AF|nr:uncharacterized protein LOC112588555 isoform X1 [Harpegnathos saltator]
MGTMCKYPPKKDKLKTTRLILSRIDPGQDWDIYNLRLHHYYNTYNAALKAAKTVLEGEVARTDVKTDYDQPRKKKKNKRYISSSEDEELDNPALHIPRGTSTEIPAPNSLLPNKFKELIKNKSVKISTKQSIEKDTSIGKSLSCNESSVKSSGHLKLTHYNITLEEKG